MTIETRHMGHELEGKVRELRSTMDFVTGDGEDGDGGNTLWWILHQPWITTPQQERVLVDSLEALQAAAINVQSVSRMLQGELQNR